MRISEFRSNNKIYILAITVKVIRIFAAIKQKEFEESDCVGNKWPGHWPAGEQNLYDPYEAGFRCTADRKKEKTKPVQHKEKIVEHKKIKKHKIKKKANNVTKKRTSVYNPIVDVHFISAMRLQEKGNYHAAINELKQASVDLYLSYYGIGYIYLKMGTNSH